LLASKSSVRCNARIDRNTDEEAQRYAPHGGGAALFE
jgi:hypothetical protein